MAHVFVGNAPMANGDLLDAFLDLDETYWVFAEFTVGTGARARQVDWLILREVPDERPLGVYSTLIVGELKETAAAFTGLENNVWNEHRNGADSPLVMGNRLDINPLHQAINIGNAVKDWLWNHERLFIDANRPPTTASDFNVWPTLVILSPPDVQHRLPHRLAFGAIWYGVEGWLGAIRGWVPRRGLQLTRQELERLARAIGESSGLAPWDPPRPTTPADPLPAAVAVPTERVVTSLMDSAPRIGTGPLASTTTTQPAAPPAIGFAGEPDDDGEGLDDVDAPPAATIGIGWLQELAAWVAETERRLERLEAALAPKQPAQPRPSTRADERFTPEERRMVEVALRRVRDRSGRPDFPGVFSELRQLNGGESLKTVGFLGWGSARTMMDQAVTEGWLTYGPVDKNGLPTLYLTDRSV